MLFVISHAVKRAPTLVRLLSIFFVFRIVRLCRELNLLSFSCRVISGFSFYIYRVFFWLEESDIKNILILYDLRPQDDDIRFSYTLPDAQL
jgi:hypothetical protein